MSKISHFQIHTFQEDGNIASGLWLKTNPKARQAFHRT